MMEELGRRAIACRHWRWMPGMLARYGDGKAWYRLTDGDGYGLPFKHRPPNPRHAWPDLTDPATLGCLLALVAEAHGVTLFDVHVVGTATGRASVWVVRLGESSERLSDGPNKLAALVAALEAAP